MTIYAAGVVCWRPLGETISVALVYREKYNDWGFAKGKQDPGEELCETAVREVEEEIGLRVRLGRKLSTVYYKVESGEDKEVHYWASKVSDKALRKSSFEPNDEIAKVEWKSAEDALTLLSYQHDRELLEEVLKLHEIKELETRALILLRHARATPRIEWKGGEATRPLLGEGVDQAKRLVNILAAYNPKRLVTSPWERCRQTVAPYAEKSGKKLISRSQLTELSSALSPRKTMNAVEDLFNLKNSALLCSHRPALPTITGTLASKAEGSVRSEILEATDLAPGEMIVLRMTIGNDPRFVATERVKVF